jgi:hypothetical protein
MNSIEEQLWSYIDGTAAADEQQSIQQLIEQDEQIQQKYLELLELNAEFAGVELDEPPMAFTYNVMETIRREEALKPFNARININIIKGISGFFIVVILAFVVLLLVNVNWSAGGTPQAYTFSLPQIPNYFTGPVMRSFLYIDLVLGLYFFNRYLRKRQNSGDYHKA